MSEVTPLDEVSRTGAPDRPFFIEAHYYEAGLRVKPLGDQAVRPVWVPPTDYVGFRNEIRLREGDTVIEVARFLFGGRRVTWVGVFVRSVDQVFGDRQNQAGVGVWLLDYDVAAPEHLLDGLRKIAAPVVKAKIDTADAGARRFVGEGYLPTYLRPATALPQPLTGWPFSTTAMPNTRLYLASSPEAEQAWALAAEQVHRMSVLPPRDGAAERALILVPGSTDGSLGQDEWADLVPLKKGLANDLLAYLPSATRQVGEENRRLASTNRSLDERLQQSEATLAETRRERQELAARTEQLERQLSDDHVLSSLEVISQRLQGVDTRTRGIETAIATVRAELANARSQQKQPALSQTPNSYQFQEGRYGSGRRDDFRTTRSDTEDRRYHFILWPLLAVMIALLGYVVWIKWLYPDPVPVSAAETEALGESLPSDEQPPSNGVLTGSAHPPPQGLSRSPEPAEGARPAPAGTASPFPGNQSGIEEGDLRTERSLPANALDR